MRWTTLLACALVLAPLTGCASPEDDQAYEVAWETEPADAGGGESVEMSWSVDGPDGEIPHTGVHYAETSVDDPQSPADYGNTSGAVEPAEVPGTFDTNETFDEAGTYYVRSHAIVGEGEHRWSDEVEIEITDGDEAGVEVTLTSHTEEAGAGEDIEFAWELEGGPDAVDRTELHWGSNGTDSPSPDAYENTAGTTQDATVPGSYEASLSDVDPGIYHARASATNDGQHHWSDEVTFEVTGTDTGAENHTVTIESFAFEPSELEVAPGDSITWENLDGVTHTATFDNETLGDSGDIDAGETYTMTVPTDVEPGTYDYICTYHPDLMQASITVVDADGG